MTIRELLWKRTLEQLLTLRTDHLVCLQSRSAICTVRHAILIHNSLYDMDIVFDPPGSGQFREVYLYEELMEADLHAIVST